MTDAVYVPDRVWLVGSGNMGGSILRRWIESGMDPARFTVIDPGTPRLPDGVAHVSEPPAGAPDALILGVKPQILDKVVPLYADRDVPLLVSMLAGVEESALARRFRARTIVRIMPNLPVAIGKGVVALYSSSPVDEDRAKAQALMAPLGLVEWLEREDLFHVVTALTGSGPGFVYRFIDALAAGGVELGLPRDQSLRFAVAMVEGASALAAASQDTPAALADKVASPGGTTRAGLNQLDAGNALRDLLIRTLDAAARRSEEMAAAARD